MSEKRKGADRAIQMVRKGKLVLSSSYGNDSIALIQLVSDWGFDDVTVVYIDTKWSAADWDIRVMEGEALAMRYGFKTVRLTSCGFEQLVRDRQGFPWPAQQFCTLHLKGLPFLEWIEEMDPEREAVVMIGKRRAESHARKETPEFVRNSEYHGGRTIWHPLYNHSDVARDDLVESSGMPLLDHRSQDCSPCVNASRKDLLMLTTEQIERVNDLEVAIGRPMFRPKRYKTVGIYGVMVWAKFGPKSGNDGEVLEPEGCGAPFGCRC